MLDKAKKLFGPFRYLDTMNMDRMPVLGLIDNKFALNKDGSKTVVMKIRGLDYNGISDQKYNEHFTARESTIRKMSDLILSSYTLRFKQKAIVKFDETGDEISDEILNIWGDSFEKCFVNNHYLALTTKKNLKEKIGPRKKCDTEKLDEACDYINTSLAEFNPKRVVGEELIGFFSSLINGKHYNKVSSINETFDKYLLNTGLEFWPRENYFTYLDDKRIASFITIKNLPERIDQKLFDIILERNMEMIISQHVMSLPNDKSISMVKDKLRFNVGLAKKFNKIHTDEMTLLLELLTANQISLSDHNMAIQIISDDLEQHKGNLVAIESLLANNNMTTTTNVLNKEPLYFSQFPSKYDSNVRTRRVNSKNVTESISFSSSGIGNKKCTWGKKPVCSFTTMDGNIFDLIFHINEAEMAMGHTLIIGGTGVGKSTFISFLLTCARTFSKMKIIGFDRLKGLEISTRMLGGKYIDFSEGGMGINPFLLKDNQANKTFLVQFLTSMLKAQGTEVLTVEDKVAQLLTWPLDGGRNIEEVGQLLGMPGDRLYDQMMSWRAGGVFESFFGAKENTFTLDNPLTMFDFTDILENTEVLGLVTSYLTHMFFSQADGNPRIVFIDEFRNYLDSPIVAKSLVKRLVEEFRKLNGVFIAAAQSIDQLWENDTGKASLNNFAKYFLFPVASNINTEAYIEGLGLTDEEVHWLNTASVSDRQMMVKVNGGTSTIINVDLKYLQEYLYVYNSSAPNVNMLNALRGQYPDSYKYKYLNEKRKHMAS